MRRDSKEMSNLFVSEKAELHAHLNGCIPQEKIKELVQKHNVEIPPDFDINKDLQILEPVNSLLEYFKPWLVLKRLPVGKECLAEMVDAAIGTLAEDNITYVEFRNSPFNICGINNISIDETVEWLIETLSQASTNYGVEAHLVISLSRYNFDLEKASELLDAMRSKNEDGMIVGVDLSGDENAPITEEVAKFFRTAKHELGLGVTMHAGETGNLENIRWAVEECHADRLAHALAAAKCQRTLEVLTQKDICLEISLISNLRTGAVKTLESHPVLTFIKDGVPFVLCSDNPQVHDSTLSDEYNLFDSLTSRRDLLESMFSTQKKYCFSRENSNHEAD